MVQNLLNGPFSKKHAAEFEKAVVRIVTEAVDEEIGFRSGRTEIEVHIYGG